MSIATKTGDDGTTSLMFGHRVPKTHARVVAYGTVDELNSALGMVRAFCGMPRITDDVLTIQEELVILMGELAVLAKDRERYVSKGFRLVDAGMVETLTARVDNLESNHRISFKHWASPGATQASAVLDVARTTCRRAERAVIAMGETGEEINPEIVRYLNRLSDLCWLWARWVETLAGVAG